MNKRGFTLIEILVVLLIIGLIVGMSVTRIETTRTNNNIDTVEADLRVFSLDINNYNLDHGGLMIEDCTTYDDASYRKEAKILITKFSNYLTNGFDVDNMIATVDTVNDKCKIQVKTTLKEDPWGNKYVALIDAKTGNLIITSNGPDLKPSKEGPNPDDYSMYSSGEFGDDVLVIIQLK